MKKTEIYKHRIKIGSKDRMLEILNYWEQGSAIIDSELCYITEIYKSSRDILRFIPESCQQVYQIKILNSDHEALILPELIEEIPYEDWIFKYEEEI